MAEEFDPFASGQATEVAAEPQAAFDPFASGQAVAVAPKEEEFDPFASGRAQAIEDTSMVDRLANRMSTERQLPAESLQRVEQARIDAIKNAPEPTLLVRLKENIKSGWSNTTIGSLLESIQEPIANEPLELRRMRATVDGLAREKARRSGALGDVMSDPSYVELPDKTLDSEIERQGKRLVAQIEKSAPETAARIKDREAALTSTAKRIGSYQGLPDYKGPIEGLASLTGQIVGSIPDPANFVGGPEVKLGKGALGKVAGKFIGEGIGAAAGNLAVEPMSQANRIRSGELDQFSPADAAKGAALGFVAGGTVGVGGQALGAISDKLKPKGPSLVEQMDGKATTNPVAANAVANDIAMGKASEVQAPPVTTAEPKIEAPSAFEQARTVEKMTPDEFNAFQIEKNITEEAKLVGDAAKTPEEIAYLKEQGKLANEQMKKLVADKDFDTLSKVMTREQFFNEAHQAATKSMAFATDEIKPVTKTKAELIKEIRSKNPDSDVEAPKQLLGKGNYEVRDVPVSEIGEVFGKDTIQTKVVANYVKNPSSDPIILADVDGDFRPVDGKHRLAAAIARGDQTIKAYVPVDSSIGKASPSLESKAYIDELLATGEITKAEHAEQLAGLGLKPEVQASKPITVAAEAPVEFVIPQELSKSNPRYKTSEVVFQDPLDKALYIIAQDAKRSARDSDFLNLVMEHTGMTEEEARAAGQKVRSRIKALAESGDGGPITLKTSKKQVTPPKVAQIDAPPAQALAPTDAPPPVPPTQAAAGGGSGGGTVPPGQTPGPTPSFNNPIPNYGWTPFISASKFGKFIKEKIGTIAGNIRAVSPELFGAVTERGFKINELKYDWSNSSREYGNIGRRLLKPEAFTELDRLLQSGLHEEAAAFIKGSKHEAEITRIMGDFKKTLDSIRRAEINAGREVGLIDNYWIRQVADYEGLRKALGRDPSNAFEKAVDAVRTQKKRALTAEEEEKVINDLISTSFSGQGKPGFLNSRTIGEIKKDWFKYYEPSDVAIEQRINRVATDVANRAYFGKFTPEGLAHSPSGFIGAIEGNFGEIIRRQYKAGTLSPEGTRVVAKNLQDFLRAESGYNEVTSKLASSIRRAQTYGYLSDLSSAIPQFGDFFLSAWRNGFLDAGKGFSNRKLNLGDIKLHQGTPDTAIYSKKNREGFVGSVFRKAVQTSIGLADGFNKGGSINTSFHEAARDMRNASSDTYKRLDRKWSERFPNRWPEIKKDLQSDAFRRGELNPNTQFFLYSELADIQPLSGEAYAQGYHQAGPFGKILYGLRSFAIKQLDVMRENGYEMMRSKDASVRSEGLKNLVTYALVVGIGQQFLSSYGRDVLFNRESNVSEYGLSGLMSLVGLNRYFIYRAGDVGFGTAALETLVPGVGIVNDLGQSAGVAIKGLTGQRSKRTGLKTVPDLPDALSKMQALKYIPWIGRGIDAYLGTGAAREKKKRDDAAAGRPQKSTLQQIGDAIVPPDTQ